MAPQLRETTASPPPGGEAESSRSPETARSVMSAFRQGWQRGLSDSGVYQDHDIDLRQDGENR